MNLKDKITEDMKDAMRHKDTLRLSTVRMLLSAIKQKEIDEQIEVTDEQVIPIVDRLIKQRKDSIAAYESAGRTDAAEKEAAEIEVLLTYLPARLSAEEIATEVQKIITTLGATGPADMGKVMGAVKKELGNKADMGIVSGVVKQLLVG